MGKLVFDALKQPFHPIQDNLGKETFKEIYGDCNKKICNQKANILLLKKDELCEFLTKLNNHPEIIARNKQSCLSIERPISLVGFFLMPSSLGNNISLKLQPIYAGQTGHEFTEFVNENVPAFIPNNFATNNNDIFPFVQYHTIQSGINHNFFQFHPDAVAKEFMKSYISWYELKCIVDNCDFLGICGSLVMTGNFGAEEKNQTQYLKWQCNTAYFTYRIIGFKKVVYNDSLPGWAKKIYNTVKEKHVNLEELIIKSNHILKDGGVIQDFAIPTETWATPCPPMWYEQ